MPRTMVVCVTLNLAWWSAVAFGQSEEWPRLALVPLVDGIDQPTHIANAGDGTGRLFLVEQPGRVRLFKDGALLDVAFLDIRDRVQAGGERGLLSIAFPPSFASSRRFYVYYTDLGGDLVISRFLLTEDPDLADAASEALILRQPHPSFANHNGGQLAFGPDGYLYIGTGDGGGGGDPFENAQNPGVLLGKMLRIDVESGVEPYAIPPDNPFVGVEGARPELWATGLRNPWRFSFDAAMGDLYIADVGQDRFEEVDGQAAAAGGGQNYGWNIMEGGHCFQPMVDCDPTGLTLPIAEYDHSDGDCAIIGGSVYRGASDPGLQGIYFYGDLCTGRIRGLRFAGDGWQSAILLESGMVITTFGTDENGNLLVADQRGGAVYRVIESPQ